LAINSVLSAKKSLLQNKQGGKENEKVILIVRHFSTAIQQLCGIGE